MDMTEVGRRMRAARKRAGKTQAEAGKGVSGSAVGQWETGSSTPTLAAFHAFCEAVGASADEILGFPRPSEHPAVKALWEAMSRLGESDRELVMQLAGRLAKLSPQEKRFYASLKTVRQK